MRRLVHLHEEQFDGHLHGACCRFPHDPHPSEPMARFVVGEDEFSKLPRKDRCSYCTRINWPHGGDPENGDAD